MLSRYLASAASKARRTVPAFGLAAAVLASSLGAPLTAAAQGPIVHDHRNGAPPVARLQVILQSIKIIDDRDGWVAGDGEMTFDLKLICIQVSAPCVGGTTSASLDVFDDKFSAGSGETRFYNRFMPDSSYSHPDYDASAAGGYPMREGQRYTLNFAMIETDAASEYERMGRGEIDLRAENGWGIGSHSVRSTHDDGSPGDYIVNIEVKRMQLPDLRPVNIKVTDIAGSTKKRVCTAVQNVELGQAGQFEVILQVDDNTLPDGRGVSIGLSSGDATDVCVEAELPAGPHKLTAVVDPFQRLIEYNEANNSYDQQTAILQLPPTVPSTTEPTQPSKDGQGQPPKENQGQAPSANTGVVPPSNQGQNSTGNQGQNKPVADLTVRAIKLNGQAPDGNNDCKEGKNGVVAVVKNAGKGKADGFTARLVVDGADGSAIEQQVNGLDAGQEREVRFGDVQLKKGAHTLAVTLVTGKDALDANLDNNGLTVTAKCGTGN
ncbi:MAG: CARDB domain-containing protein [Chloroflexota bacterium]